MDIDAWLRNLGLERFSQIFRQQEVDFELLTELSENDLERLGIPFGPRKRILKAIAEHCGKASPVIPTSLPGSDATAERRQVTVLFCDLVGSTALAASLDPEDMREIIRAYQDVCSRVIARHGGFLARFLGDGVLAYFGYPRAHEDAAERAVRAGLEMVRAVEHLELRGIVTLSARVGIATGTVVIGDLIGEGAAQERAVVGEAPNVAARLQGAAEPGMVVIAASTRRLLGSLFRLRDLGHYNVKGYSEPMAIWAVEAVAAVESRFEALRSEQSIPLIGREQELNALIERGNLAWRGEGQIIVISGEPGIGKSHLADWFARHVEPETHTRLRYQCSPYHSNTAFYPFIQQLQRAAGIDPADSPSKQLDKLETLIALGTSDVARVAPLFAALLSISAENRYPALAMSAAEQRRQTMSALLGQVEGLTCQKPVLLLFEDLHWADATSLELINLAADRIRNLPVFAIFTVRSEFVPPWCDLPHVRLVALDRLKPPQVREIVHRVVGGREMPAEIMDRIIAKTDGIPLFVEELTKTLLESGVLVETPDGHRLDSGASILAIPSTLQDSLMARIDRLETARQVAQVGAVIGRNFSYSMITTVLELEDEAVRGALEKLVEAQLVHQRGSPPDALYTFKHALVQDTAYQSLLRSRRQILHARIVETIETHFPRLVETECEVLARHCSSADLADRAIKYWTMAGQRSLDRSHLSEAITHLRSAINLILNQPDSIERQKREFSCQALLAQALVGARGYGAKETMDAWRRAQTLAAEVGNAEQQFATSYGLWVGQYAQGDLEATLSLAAATLRAAEVSGNRTQLCIAHRMNGIAHLITGDFTLARDACLRSQEFYDQGAHRPLANRLGHDLLVAPLCFKALSLWPLGYPDQAREAIDAVFRHAEQLDHPPSLGYAHWHAGVIGMLMLRDVRRLSEHADALLALARQHGLAMWELGGRAVQGWLSAQQGEGARGVSEIRLAVDTLRKIGARANETLFLGLLGEAQAAAGEVAAGLATIAEATAFGLSSRQCFWLTELYRLDGTLRLRLPNADSVGAESALRQAIAVAQRQRAISWQLRAANDLAALLAKEHRAEESRVLLRGLYAQFQEGFDTPDLIDARALIAHLTVSRPESVESVSGGYE